MAMVQIAFRTRPAFNRHSTAAARRMQRAGMPLFQAFLRPSSAKVTDGLCIKDATTIDPCMGSGHILCVLFDTLVRIYEDYGYTAREAAASIVENNLWGLDIDERAAQLSYFAVMMKARQYDRRFFSRGIQPHVYAIEESNGLRYDGDYGDFLLDKSQQETLNYMFDAFKDAKEYGSILDVESRDYDGFLQAWSLTAEQSLNDLRMLGWYMVAGEKVVGLANQAKAMSQKYQVVVTNPPYMGGSGMSSKLANYVLKNYGEAKNDLFAVFMQRCKTMTLNNCFQAMITQNAWMFLSGFEKLRESFISVNFVNMIHLGARAFEEIAGEVVQTTSFVFRNTSIPKYRGTYCRLVDGSNQNAKEKMFLNGEGQFISAQNDYSNIPGLPIAYWVSKEFAGIFNNRTAEDFALKICKGGFTGNNEKYLRLWFEVSTTVIPQKWNPYSKGGGYRKWYGNSMHVILWENDGYALKHEPKAGVGASKYYGKEHIVWSGISTGLPSFRDDPNNVYFDDVSPSVVFANETNWRLLAILNSKVTQEVLKIIAPTMHFQAGDIKVTPIPDSIESIDEEIVRENVRVSKEDWDAFETSWDFATHPLVRDVRLIEDAFKLWKEECDHRFDVLKRNEELLNKAIILLYGLEDEMLFDIDETSISIRRADLGREIRGLISYAVGCMFGRYSLDVPGLAFAGGEWDESKYTTFLPDKDAIIPICDDEYFNDDIVGRFVQFVKTVYGEDSLEENLNFIAQALGGKGTSRSVIREYFINNFYADHCAMYSVTGSGKRPIYWLFDSGKKNGFKCLVYMHRYQPDTIARIRTDYVHEQQSRYRTAIADLEQRINGASTSERVKLNKQLTTMQAQATEIREYEEKIHHLADQMICIDLDDGVKHNYEIFKDVLAKIK